MHPRLHVHQSPASATALALARASSTTALEFRSALSLVAQELLLRASELVPTQQAQVKTPLGEASATIMAPVALIPILRAGLILMESGFKVFPDATLGLIGLSRNEVTLENDCYTLKLPELADKTPIVLEPMVATGGSLRTVLDILTTRTQNTIIVVSVLALESSVSKLLDEYPQLHVCCASLEDAISDSGFLVPGLGDAGDRAFGYTV